MSDYLSEGDRDMVGKMLGNPILFPKEFKTWLMDHVAVNIPLIPFSHLFGSHVNIARSGAYVPAIESTTSTSYTDLATVGPELTHMADGKYLIAYGVRSRSYASISINGATPSDDDAIFSTEAIPAGSRQKIVSLTNNNDNSIRMQYKGGFPFSRRWLIAIRIGAP